MNRILIFFLAFTLFASSGCKKEENTPPPTPAPTVNFTFSPSTGGTAPATIMFLLEYSNATSFVWDFGDGNTSTGQNPSNTYTSPGTYTVRLTGTGPGGTATVSRVVTITTPAPLRPLALFIVNSSYGFAPETISFSNISNNATSYFWDFGDGTSSSMFQPSKVYTVGGTYTVRLTATGPGGSNMYSSVVTIRNAPTQMLLRSFTIRNMPFVDSGGSSFDLSDGPDVFFKLLNASGTVLQTSTITNNVTQAQLPIGWTFNTPYSITNLGSQYTLSLLDYDGISANDQIRNLTFIPSNLDPDLTTQITWTGTNLSAELEVEFR